MSFSEDELKLSGGVAVITGAGGGIGSGLARRAGQLGMTVIVADISIEKAEKVASNILNSDGKAEAIVVDVSQPKELDRLADYVFGKYGSVRLLVNNAGIETLGFCWEVSTAQWESTLNVNIHGVIHGVRAFVPRMLAMKEECWIANLSSSGAFAVMPTQGAYIMTKHAVQSFTEGLFLDLKLIGAPIHVSSVIPGLMRTGIFDATSDPPPTDVGGCQLRAYQQAMAEMARDCGMDVKQGSEIILKNVAAGEFWVSTHPETTAKIVGSRIEFLKDQKNPEIMPGSKHLLDY
ncbi:short-chain dehydrogenase/reductase SDR [Thelonectria olida]|uniref:Short-chain dehydrogenase/reductase SDR n=1 Tax=Thelonectria olida TaxID=1576542 RepID=A0A9P9AIP9_9HYPO|nr:short-chain dehydrogenase/reductase SDR [Thelonectria olida]